MDDMRKRNLMDASVKLKKVHESMIISLSDIMKEAVPEADTMDRAETIEALLSMFTAEDIYYILQYHDFDFPKGNK